MFISISFSSAQTVGGKKDPVGKWKFEAPYAPEGYTSGSISIGFSENKYSAIMELAGAGIKFAGENVKIKNDSISFFLNIEDESVLINLKLESSTKMTGRGVYSEGVIPITLTRSEAVTED